MRSLIESFIDVGSGFILAILIQLLIFPLFDLYPSIFDSLGIAAIFTIVSITRSWIWRLVFKKGVNQDLIKLNIQLKKEIEELNGSWEKYDETRNKLKKKEQQDLLDTFCKGDR